MHGPHLPLSDAAAADEARIKAVITAAGGTLTKAEIVAALKDDAGPSLSGSRVGEVLSELTGEGTLTSVKRGTYKLP
ncbi:hypothetical protein ACODT4_44695 [Streptomyces sp. 2.9]|uniref:hypothetical protein n=1 Tax=Streptomyces tritrimontium TaxID=3406573 RepID=UPI003BB4FF0B